MENENLIRKIAWSFSKSTGIEYKELFAEACLWYCEAVRSHTPALNCKLTSYAWIVMRNKLVDFINKEKQYGKEVPYSAMPEEQAFVSYQPIPFSEFLAELPEECRCIAEIVLDSLDELPDELPPKMARGRIEKILRERGWSWPRIRRSVRTMKIVCST